MTHRRSGDPTDFNGERLRRVDHTLVDLEDRLMTRMDKRLMEHEQASVVRERGLEDRVTQKFEETIAKFSEGQKVQLDKVVDTVSGLVQEQRDARVKAEARAELIAELGIQPSASPDTGVRPIPRDPNAPSPVSDGLGQLLSAAAENIKFIALAVIIAAGGSGAALQAFMVMHAEDSTQALTVDPTRLEESEVEPLPEN